MDVKNLHQKELAHVAIELCAVNNRRDELLIRYKELQIVLNTVDATAAEEQKAAEELKVAEEHIAHFDMEETMAREMSKVPTCYPEEVIYNADEDPTEEHGGG